MGYTNRQRLFAVQFPIAVPVIGAGLRVAARVAAVSNVSLVSVASLLGVAQLGTLFTEGSQLNSLPPILLGLILIILLALLFDTAIVIGIRLLTPWQRAVSAR